MARTYKTYDEDYKKNIVKLVENGKAISDIEREYGINRKLIYNWKNKYGTIITSTGDVTSNDEIIQLKKELNELKVENEILKKAVAIFTKK
jgi:transposase